MAPQEPAKKMGEKQTHNIFRNLINIHFRRQVHKSKWRPLQGL